MNVRFLLGSCTDGIVFPRTGLGAALSRTMRLYAKLIHDRLEIRGQF